MATSSSVSVKTAMLFLALLALISPTFSSSLKNPNPTNGDGFDQSPVSPDWLFGSKKCPNIMKEQMAERVLNHIHVSKGIKDVLRWNVKFINCVAAKFCVCMKLRFEPLIFGCFAAVGGFCMVTSLKGLDTDCTLDCVNRITANNHPLLGIYIYIYIRYIIYVPCYGFNNVSLFWMVFCDR